MVVVGTGGRVAGPVLVPHKYSSFVELETVVRWRRELRESLKKGVCAHMVESMQRQLAEEVAPRWRNLADWLSWKRESRKHFGRCRGGTYGMKWFRGVSCNSDTRGYEKTDGRRRFSPVGVVWRFSKQLQRKWR
jgi:hypothetical protein